MNVHISMGFVSVRLEFPHWLGDRPRPSHTSFNHFHGAPGLVITNPSYSHGDQECTPRVCFCPEVDPSKFTLSLLSGPPGGSQWLQCIMLMQGKGSAQHNIIRMIWIMCFLYQHSVFTVAHASRMDRQCSDASNCHTIQLCFPMCVTIMWVKWISDTTITNVDEKGFVRGISPCTKVVRQHGKQNPRNKQDGQQEFCTALEAVFTDGWVFPPHHFGRWSEVIFDRYTRVGKKITILAGLYHQIDGQRVTLHITH